MTATCGARSRQAHTSWRLQRGRTFPSSRKQVFEALRMEDALVQSCGLSTQSGFSQQASKRLASFHCCSFKHLNTCLYSWTPPSPSILSVQNLGNNHDRKKNSGQKLSFQVPVFCLFVKLVHCFRVLNLRVLKSYYRPPS